jgi:hypothetical protein
VNFSIATVTAMEANLPADLLPFSTTPSSYSYSAMHPTVNIHLDDDDDDGIVLFLLCILLNPV